MSGHSIEPHTEYVRGRVHCLACGTSISEDLQETGRPYCPGCSTPDGEL